MGACGMGQWYQSSWPLLHHSLPSVVLSYFSLPTLQTALAPVHSSGLQVAAARRSLAGKSVCSYLALFHFSLSLSVSSHILMPSSGESSSSPPGTARQFDVPAVFTFPNSCAPPWQTFFTPTAATFYGPIQKQQQQTSSSE